MIVKNYVNLSGNFRTKEKIFIVVESNIHVAEK